MPPQPKSPDTRARNAQNYRDRYFRDEPVTPRKLPPAPVGGWSRMAQKLWKTLMSEGWTVLLSDTDWVLAETWLLTVDRHHRLLADPNASAAAIAALAAESRRAQEAFGGTAAARARRHWWPLEQASERDRARLATVTTFPTTGLSMADLGMTVPEG